MLKFIKSNKAEKLLPYGIALLALLTFITNLSQRSLNGDEYGSIFESINFGTNWNGFPYFFIAHIWVMLNQSEIWLRLLSIIFGVSAAVILFFVGKKLNGNWTGVIAGLLAATSPFLALHSQEFRFYSMFIFFVSLFVYFTVSLPKKNISRLSWIKWIGVALLTIASQFLGILSVVAISIADYTSRRKHIYFMVGGLLS